MLVSMRDYRRHGRYNQRASLADPLVKIQPRVLRSVRERLTAAAKRWGVSESGMCSELLADALDRLEAWETEQEEADPEGYRRVMACKQGMTG